MSRSRSLNANNGDSREHRRVNAARGRRRVTAARPKTLAKRGSKHRLSLRLSAAHSTLRTQAEHRANARQQKLARRTAASAISRRVESAAATAAREPRRRRRRRRADCRRSRVARGSRNGDDGDDRRLCAPFLLQRPFHHSTASQMFGARKQTHVNALPMRATTIGPTNAAVAAGELIQAQIAIVNILFLFIAFVHWLCSTCLVSLRLRAARAMFAAKKKRLRQLCAFCRRQQENASCGFRVYNRFTRISIFWALATKRRRSSPRSSAKSNAHATSRVAHRVVQSARGAKKYEMRAVGRFATAKIEFVAGLELASVSFVGLPPPPANAKRRSKLGVALMIGAAIQRAAIIVVLLVYSRL